MNDTTIINGHTVKFERRRYGRTFYCWAYVLNGAEALLCGDPWPASQWPRKALAEAVNWAMAGKVTTEAAQ